MTSWQPELIVLATGNPHKLRELRSLLAPLACPLLSLADCPPVADVTEEGATIAENARRKAAGFARGLALWVLADDTGLEVDALGGAPGVRAARFAGDHATMRENRQKLLDQLRHVAPPHRAARFVCHLAVANPNGQIVLEAAGQCRGQILPAPSDGTYGFGYDTLFLVDGLDRTLAQLPPAEVAVVGHRGRAVRQLLASWPVG